MCRSGWSHLRGERAGSSLQSPSVETEDDPGDQRKGKDRRAELRRHYGEGNAASHQLADQPAAPHIEEDRQRGEEPVHPIVAEEDAARSEEHTSELQSLMRISYAVFCLKKKKKTQQPRCEQTTM